MLLVSATQLSVIIHAVVFKVWDALMFELLDEMILGFCFEMHRSCKRGTLFLDEVDDE